MIMYNLSNLKIYLFQVLLIYLRFVKNKINKYPFLKRALVNLLVLFVNCFRLLTRVT